MSLEAEVETLRRETTELRAINADQHDQIERFKQDIESLQQQLRRLLSGRRHGDTHAEGQGLLFPPEEEHELVAPEHLNEAPDGETPEDSIKKANRPERPARKIDTSNLEREVRVHELPEEERFCEVTGLPLVPVGVKTFEEIDFQPSKVKLIVHERVIYGLDAEHAKDRMASQVVTPLPPRAVEGCTASAGLIAWILVQKYLMHLPLYRQEMAFQQDGLRLPRKTMCDWVLAAAEVLHPIVAALLRQIRAGPIMQIDDTRIRCQGPKGAGQYQAYLWTYVNPEVEGMAYVFTSGRSTDLIAEGLQGFKGYLVGDGYAGNKAAARKVDPSIILCGCWAHSFRKFRDAMKESPAAAKLYMHDIGILFKVEEESRSLDEDFAQRLERRKRECEAPLDRMRARKNGWRERYSESGDMATALTYLDNQWDPLTRFLEDGRIPIDNNRCERSIRPIGIGRKNWMFAGSERGGRAAATIYSLVESCKLANVNVHEYLADVLVRVATHPASRVEELVPAKWATMPWSPTAEAVAASTIA